MARQLYQPPVGAPGLTPRPESAPPGGWLTLTVTSGDTITLDTGTERIEVRKLPGALAFRAPKHVKILRPGLDPRGAA